MKVDLIWFTITMLYKVQNNKFLFIALTLCLRQSLAGQAEHSLRGSMGQRPIVATPLLEWRPADGEIPFRSRALQGGELRQPNLFGIAARGGRSAIIGYSKRSIERLRKSRSLFAFAILLTLGNCRRNRNIEPIININLLLPVSV